MTSRLILSLYDRSYLHQMHQGSTKEWEVYCEFCRRRVGGEDGRRRVGGGGNVGCSVECDMECAMVTSGGDILLVR